MHLPGKLKFDAREDAMNVAIARVLECWIVHCYREGDKWVVNWWAQ